MLILEGTDAVGKSTVINNLSGYDLYIEQKGLLKDRVFLADCTDLNEEEEKNKVKKIVDYILNNSNDKIAKKQI